MDRRQHRRFDLSAPVTFSWEDEGSMCDIGHGTTRDVSECGLFVLTDLCPPLGTDIDFEVSFPFRDDSQIQMKVRGKVVRIEPSADVGALQGFASETKVLWLQNAEFS
jgi:hypothetical protein